MEPKDIIHHFNIAAASVRDRREQIQARLKELEAELDLLETPHHRAMIERIANAIAEKTGTNTEVLGPAGLACRYFLSFTDKVTDRQLYSLSLQVDVEPGGKFTVAYETGRTVNRYQAGTIGYMNGLNNVTEPLPDTLEETIKILKPCQDK